MIDAFLLLVYLGTGDLRKLESGNMYFYSIKVTTLPKRCPKGTETTGLWTTWILRTSHCVLRS